MHLSEVERISEAGMALARATSPDACVGVLLELAVEITGGTAAGFRGHGRLEAIRQGSIPDELPVTTEGSPAGAVLAQHGDWMALCVRDGSESHAWSGALWVQGAPADRDALRLGQILARQASVALEMVVHRTTVEARSRTERALVEAGKILSQEQTLEGLLQRIVEVATELVGARYGALGVLDDSGEHLAQFITTGIDDETRRKIGPLPTGKGILGVLIHEPTPLRLRRIGDDPRSYGFPKHHPPMSTFLGVPILSRNAVKGRLYLTEKEGGEQFSTEDEQVAVTLASQAAIAIENTELYQQLSEANKHKSAFLASMSHELRTPLNSILGYAQLLLQEAESLDPDQLEDVQAIHSSGTHLLALITELLDLSRIEAGRLDLVLEQVDVAAMVRNVAGLVRPQLDETGTALEVDAPEALTIECDSIRVRQMLLNVVGNAIKFAQGGRIELALHDRGDDVCFAVTDDGPGIPPDDLQRIFQSFFQSAAALNRTPREREGAGLGLAITRMLAELHGGSVDIESELGAGTTVSIVLPKATRPELLHG